MDLRLLEDCTIISKIKLPGELNFEDFDPMKFRGLNFSTLCFQKIEKVRKEFGTFF